MTERTTLPWRAELARKAIHIATAVLPLSLAFGWTTLEALRLVLTGAAALALLIEIGRKASSRFAERFASAVGGLLRGHERGALTGATWLALAMAIVLWAAPLHAAVAALWAAAVGDAAAALVGKGLSRLRATKPTGKTLAGSLAALVATALGVWWLTPATAAVAAGIGAVAALAERPALPVDDNLRITLAVAVAASLVGLR